VLYQSLHGDDKRGRERKRSRLRSEGSGVVTSASNPSTPRLLNRSLALVLLSVFGTGASFYLLLSVVPLYATSLGSGAIGAGTVTGALMFSTVITEMATPLLLSKLGYRPVFAAGVLLLGLPALGLPAATSLVAILAICIARGVGLAVMSISSGPRQSLVQEANAIHVRRRFGSSPRCRRSACSAYSASPPLTALTSAPQARRLQPSGGFS
jgi:MFS family permease